MAHFRGSPRERGHAEGAGRQRHPLGGAHWRTRQPPAAMRPLCDQRDGISGRDRFFELRIKLRKGRRSCCRPPKRGDRHGIVAFRSAKILRYFRGAKGDIHCFTAPIAHRFGASPPFSTGRLAAAAALRPQRTEQPPNRAVQVEFRDDALRRVDRLEKAIEKHLSADAEPFHERSTEACRRRTAFARRGTCCGRTECRCGPWLTRLPSVRGSGRAGRRTALRRLASR